VVACVGGYVAAFNVNIFTTGDTDVVAAQVAADGIGAGYFIARNNRGLPLLKNRSANTRLFSIAAQSGHRRPPVGRQPCRTKHRIFCKQCTFLPLLWKKLGRHQPQLYAC
jgi:hypothetical protein